MTFARALLALTLLVSFARSEQPDDGSDPVPSLVFIAAGEKHRWPDRFGDAPSKLIAVAQEKQARALKRARKCWKKVRRVLRRDFR